MKLFREIGYFFRLSRPVNVVTGVIAFTVAAFLATGRELWFLADAAWWLISLSITLIMASGYWINDVYDHKIDQVNKPKKLIVNLQLSTKKVLTAYFAVNGTVLAASFAGIFLFPFGDAAFLINASAMLLLFIYAAWLKRTSVTGNLVVSLLTALVIFYAGIIYGLKVPVLWMIMFAFEVTFLREVTKDVEDIRGDLKFRLQTLPIRIGIRSTKRVLLFCYVIFIISCWIPFFEAFLRLGKWNFIYLVISILLVQLPALILMRLLAKAGKPADFSLQSKLLKVLIFAGMASLFFL